METQPKAVSTEVIGNKIYINFIGEPIPPVKKALLQNGFKNKKGVYVAEITMNNEFFIKLLTGGAKNG